MLILVAHPQRLFSDLKLERRLHPRYLTIMRNAKFSVLFGMNSYRTNKSLIELIEQFATAHECKQCKLQKYQTRCRAGNENRKYARINTFSRSATSKFVFVVSNKYEGRLKGFLSDRYAVRPKTYQCAKTREHRRRPLANFILINISCL